MDELKNTTEGYQTTPGSFSTPPSSVGLIVKIAIGTVVVGLIGTGIALDAKIWDPSWNPFRENAEKNVEKMIDRMMEVKTMHSDMEVGIEMTDKDINGDGLKLIVFSKGDSNSTDAENPKSSGDFNIVVATGGIEFNLAGQEKTLNENESYFKIDTIPMIPDFVDTPTLFGIDIDEIQGKWIKSGQDDSSQMGDIDELMELSENFQEKIKEIIGKEKAYYVKETLNSEKIGGQSMYHYVLSPNKEIINEIFLEYVEMMFGYSGETLSLDEKQEAEKDTNKFLEKIGDIDVEAWIGKRDNYLYRIKFEKEINAEMIDEDAQGKLIVKFDMNMSDFNKPVMVEAPTDFIEFNDLLGYYVPILNKAKEAAQDARIVSAVSQLRTEAALVDAFEDGYGSFECAYSDDTKALCDDIVNQGGNVTIYSNTNEYCIYSVLNDGNYYCIDSTGTIGTTTSKPIACNGTTFLCPSDLIR